MMTAVLAGLVLAAAFPNPFHKEFVPQGGALAALGMAFYLCHIPVRFGEAFRRGYLTGLIWFSILLYWVALIREAGPAVAIPGYLFLVLYCSVFPGLILGALSWAFRGRPHDALLAAPFLWASGEWIRTWAFSGFPWGVLAQAMAGDRSWLPPLAVAGPYGPSFLAVLAGALGAWSFLKGPKPSTLLALFTGAASLVLLGGGALGSAAARAPLGGTARIALLQGAVSQDVKWTEESKLNNFLIYGSLQALAAAKKPRPDLIVWPEASSTVAFELEPDYKTRFQKKIVDRGGIPTVVGAPFCLDPETGLFTNSAQLWLPGKGQGGRYDKAHLVPLGEYVPFAEKFAIIQKLARGGGAGDFAAGLGPVLFEAGDLKLSPNICYEIIFPDLVRRGVLLGAGLIVNLTNDDWYGATSMPAQHLAFAVLRSVENGVPVARAANTGISALVDPRKGITARTSLGERQVLAGDVVPSTERTFYTRHGDVFVHLCFGFSLFLLAAGRLRARSSQGLS